MTDARLGSVVLETDVAIPRRDGIVLRADVYRPSGPVRVPALLMRLPYDKRQAQTYWYAAPAWYAERGYAVVVEDVRGRHRSGGHFVPLEHEAQDGLDLVAWAAEQAWCDAQVGSFGYSYCGLVQLLASGCAGDLPLRAIAPALSPPGLGDGCLLQAGVPAAAFLLTWAVELGGLRLGSSAVEPFVLTRDLLRQLVLRPLDELAACIPPEACDWMRHWLRADSEDGYWRSASHQPAYGSIRAEALHVAGWYDTFRTGAIGHFQQLRRVDHRALTSDRLVVGPWTHQPVRADHTSPLAGPDPAGWQIDDMQLSFFDAVLRGGNVAEGALVRVAGLNTPDVWTGTAWPPPEAVPSAWFLGSRGGANGRDGDGLLTDQGVSSCPPDHLVYNHADPVPAVGGDDCGDPDLVDMGPADQERVERRRDVLVYTSPPVSRETSYFGEAEATLYVMTTGASTQWLVRVCLVTANGVSVNVAETVARCPTTPGEVTPVRLFVGPVAFRLHRGERVRLHVTQGSSPRWAGLRDDCGELAVTHSIVLHDPAHPSCLRLSQVA